MEHALASSAALCRTPGPGLLPRQEDVFIQSAPAGPAQLPGGTHRPLWPRGLCPRAGNPLGCRTELTVALAEPGALLCLCFWPCALGRQPRRTAGAAGESQALTDPGPNPDLEEVPSCPLLVGAGGKLSPSAGTRADFALGTLAAAPVARGNRSGLRSGWPRADRRPVRPLLGAWRVGCSLLLRRESPAAPLWGLRPAWLCVPHFFRFLAII